MDELFEFTDVDVAAFESVATTPPPPPPAPEQHMHQEGQQQQQYEEQNEDHLHQDLLHHHLQQQQQEQQQHEHQLDEEMPDEQQHNLDQQPQQLQLQFVQQQSSQQRYLQQASQSQQQQQGQRPCKILLIPIDSSGKPLIKIQSAPSNKKRTVESPQPKPEEIPKRKPCNCTKSRCLKLYCDCFANGEFCNGCNCTNCSNSLTKEKERQQAISQCLERNPEAFRPKIGKAVRTSIERRHTKGCNCKRSGCLKNYCECYEAKILCSNLCKCCGCKNYEESFERKSLMQLANSTAESARGILKNLLPVNNNNSGAGKEFAKSYITDSVIKASLVCLLQSAQQAENEATEPFEVPNIIHREMGKCLRMIVDSATS